jgi:hypothetical protein
VEARQEAGERYAEEARLEVPQSDVDCGDGHRPYAGPPGVTDRDMHRRPGSRRREGIGPGGHFRQLRLDHRRDRDVAVGVPEAALAAALDLDHDAGRRVPHERAVRLGGVLHRHVEGAHANALDGHPATSGEGRGAHDARMAGSDELSG